MEYFFKLFNILGYVLLNRKSQINEYYKLPKSNMTIPVHYHITKRLAVMYPVHDHITKSVDRLAGRIMRRALKY